jgi:hypothetical protein
MSVNENLERSKALDNYIYTLRMKEPMFDFLASIQAIIGNKSSGVEHLSLCRDRRFYLLPLCPGSWCWTGYMSLCATHGILSVLTWNT